MKQLAMCMEILGAKKIGRYAGMFFYLLLLMVNGKENEKITYFLLMTALLYVMFRYKKNGYLFRETKPLCYCKLAVFFSAVISAVVGVDRGESIFGVVRLLAIFAVDFGIRQMDTDVIDGFIKKIPYIGVFLLLCCSLYRFPIFECWVSANTGRIAGPFEYPNTMALFLLAGIVISENFLPENRKWRWQSVLCIGVLLTGSRTAFILLVLLLIYYFFKSSKKSRYTLWTFIGIVLLVSLISIWGIGISSWSRFLTIRIDSGTLQGRFLYWEDAFKMLLKYPMGLGYMGYFYKQQMMQSGVYSVRFVHNEWLQMMLDYGIMAGIFAVIYIRERFKGHQAPKWKKELLLLIGIYSFFDFHLQFWSIILLVLLALPGGNDAVKIKIKTGWKCGYSIALVISIIGLLQFQIAESYAENGHWEKALEWRPFSTEYGTEWMMQAQNLQIAERRADWLLANNRHLYAAYLIKSNAAAQDRNLHSFIAYRKRALALRKYEIKGYEEYFQILITWYMEAKNNGNEKTAEDCKVAMKEIPQVLLDVKRQTSVRAFRIKEKPGLLLNKEYEEIIEML